MPIRKGGIKMAEEDLEMMDMRSVDPDNRED